MSDEQDFRDDIGTAPDVFAIRHLPDAAWWSQRLFLWLNRGRRVLIVATIALIGWSVLQQLDLGLTRMHVNDVKSYGPSALVGPSLKFPKPWDDAVATWDKYRVQACRASPPAGVKPRECRQREVSAALSARAALFRHFAVDTTLFMYPSAFLLWFLLWRAWRRARSSPAVPDALRQVLALTLVLPALALGLDALENVGVAIIVARWTHSLGSVFVGVLSAITLAKWLCIFLMVIVLVIVTVRLYYAPGSQLRSDVGRTIRRLVALRAQVIAAGSVTLLLGLSVFSADLGNQLLDVIVRWVEHGVIGVLAFAGLALLTAVLVVTGRFSLRDYDGASTATSSMSTATPLILAGVGAAAIVLGIAFAGHRWALLPAGVALLLFAVLSAPSGVRAANPQSVSFAGGGGWVYPFLVVVPAWVFAILLTRVAVTLDFQRGGSGYVPLFTALCFLAGAIAVTGALLAHGYESWQPSTADRVVSVGVMGAGAVVVAAAWVTGIVDPLGFGVDVGALAIVGLFATGLCLVLVGLTTLGNHWRAKGPLAVLQFRRVPVITFVVAFVVFGSALDTDTRMHDVRLQGALTAKPVTLATAWDAWVKALPPNNGGDVPMVFVASTGGGIRAAYWTAVSMGCLFGIRPPSHPDGSSTLCAHNADVDAQRVFLASGISGGSLGLVAEFAGRPQDAAPRLRNDFVSPVISQLLLVDTPNALLRLDGVDDRAVVLEHAWEQAWSDQHTNPLQQPLFAWQRRHLGKKPVLVLNGATVEDGCRMAATALETAVTAPTIRNPELPLSDRSCTSLAPFLNSGPTGAGTPDPSLVRTTSLYDLSCGATDDVHHDVALSTAALLSARFPVVSPTGGLYHCGTKGTGTKNTRVSDVDGGAIETSAAKPIAEVFAQLAPLVQAANAQRGSGCIRPRLILLDNNYVSSARGDPAGRQLESQLLLKAKGIGGKGLTAAARQEAALAFDHFFAGTCGHPTSSSPPASAPGDACSNSVAYIVPSEHPGVRAPLGWTLSKVSADDMDDQLTGPWNSSQLNLARSWFAPNAC